MINKFRKLPILVKLGLITLFLFIILWKLVDYYSYRESRENDSLPVILSSNVRMERVNESNEYETVGNNCSLDEQKKVAQVLKGKYDFEVEDKYVSCKKFTTTKGTFYDVDPGLGCRGTLLLEKIAANIEFVIKDGAGKPGGYPCNGFTILHVNNDNIVLRYKGWHNPTKILKLIVN